MQKRIIDDNYRIICFSDIHGNNEALKSLINEFKKIKPNIIIFMGDAIGFGPKPNECIDIIRKNNIIYLEGNHEFYQSKVGRNFVKKSDQELKSIDWVHSKITKDNLQYINNLEKEYILKYKELTLSFSHFLFGLNHQSLYLNYLYKHGIDDYVYENNKYDYVFFGHEHKPFVKEHKGSIFYDVGTSGCTKDILTHYELITFNNGEVNIQKKFVRYDRNNLLNEFNLEDYPNKEHYQKNLFGLK